MLAFLIGTSILNILVGFTLAVYLMRNSHSAIENQNHSMPSKTASSGAPRADALDSFRGRPQETPRPASPAIAGESELNVNLAMRSPGDSESEMEEGIDRGPKEVDEQLLAGIADFRSQLAKLRSEPDADEPRRRPAPQVKS